MHPALRHLDHRPWPIPDRPWTWRQSWYDLLFAHWRVPVDVLRPMIPAGLNLQDFDGSAWLGVIPFRMAGVMRRPFPDLPWVSAFPELNVRTYVERGGKPGVWFFSLDARNGLAVWAARRWFHLPYFLADMTFQRQAEWVVYRSERPRTTPPVRFTARYRPAGGGFHARPGSLEAFLVERYCLYAQGPDGRLHRGEVHHEPWTLHPAEAEIDPRELLATHGLDVGTTPPLLHFTPSVDVVTWSLTPCD